MKYIIAFSMGLLVFCGTGTAQQRVVQKQFQAGESQKLSLDLKFGEHIQIMGWNKDEVALKVAYSINGGKLNDAFLLTYEERDQMLRIATDFDKKKLEAGRSEDCPGNVQQQVIYGSKGYATCSEISYTLQVPAHMDVLVESISADIELVDVRGPVRAKSISGFIDVSWPSAKAATVDMKTITGSLYSDMDELQLHNKKARLPLVGYTLKGRIASGGPLVSLESVSGNIYLRQAKKKERKE